jgi:hypothetical protein
MNEPDQAPTHRLARIRVGLKSSIWIPALLFITKKKKKKKQVGMTNASAVFRLDDDQSTHFSEDSSPPLHPLVSIGLPAELIAFNSILLEKTNKRQVLGSAYFSVIN